MFMYIQTGQSFEIEYNLFVWTEKRLIRKYRTNQGASNSMSNTEQRSGLRSLHAKRRHKSHTSFAVTFNASQSTLGNIFLKNEGLYSISDCSSSASWKCSGKESGEVLHALTAHVKKFTVRTFIFILHTRSKGLRIWMRPTLGFDVRLSQPINRIHPSFPAPLSHEGAPAK